MKIISKINANLEKRVKKAGVAQTPTPESAGNSSHMETHGMAVRWVRTVDSIIQHSVETMKEITNA